MSKVKGIATYESLTSDFNILSFIIENSIKGLVNTCLAVTVIDVDIDNQKVTIKPLVAQKDSSNKRIEMPEIYEIPYFRYAGGKSAIILDPKVNDIGFMVIFQSDSTNLTIGNTSTILPNSATSYPLNSGVYVGGFLNNLPETFIKIEDDTITIKSTKDININCENANIKADGEVNITSNNINLGSKGGAGIVTKDCICAFTGGPHTQGSSKVKASL